MSGMIAWLLGFVVGPAGTLVWTDAGPVLAIALTGALLLATAALFVVRERPKAPRRLSAISPRLGKRSARLPSPA